MRYLWVLPHWLRVDLQWGAKVRVQLGTQLYRSKLIKRKKKKTMKELKKCGGFLVLGYDFEWLTSLVKTESGSPGIIFVVLALGYLYNTWLNEGTVKHFSPTDDRIYETSRMFFAIFFFPRFLFLRCTSVCVDRCAWAAKRNAADVENLPDQNRS